MARIDAEADRDLDRLVELRERRLLDDLQRLARLVGRCDVAVLRGGRRTSFRDRASVDDLQAHRARGAGDHRHGRLDRVAVQVGHLDLGDLADLRRVTLPTLLRFG